MRAIFPAVLPGLVLLGFLASGSARAAAVEPATVTVRIPAEAVDSEALRKLTPRFQADYGSFLWMELEGDQVEALVRAGVPVSRRPHASLVRVPGYSFDPGTDGEPELAPEDRTDSAGERLRLVQFRGPIKQEWLDSLSAVGARPLQYYPHQAYLVWAGEGAVSALASFEAVRWQGLFHPAYKVNQDLRGRRGILERVDVVFYDDGDRQATLDAVAALGGELEAVFPAQPDGVLWNAVIRLPATAVELVARLNTVLWLGDRGPGPELEDEMSSQIVAGNHPGGVPVTGYLAHLSTLGVDGTGVIWAVGDTGIDYDHPDLGPRIVGGFSSGGCDPVGEPASDCGSARGHGTHVAGIIGGDASGAFADGDGFLYGLGIAPEVDFFAMNIFTGSDPYQEFSRQAFLAGASGTNNSWTTGEGTGHGYQNSERTFDFMVRDADFTTGGVAEPHIVVFSAGNSGPGSLTLTAPKEAKNVIVTAGTQNFRTSSNIDAMYNSSSRGPAVDGRYVPTIAAPGQTIISARNDLGGSCTGSTVGGTSNLYSFCSGTSMAAPQASGAVALITQWWRGLAGGDPSPALAKALLINTAVDISSTPPIPNFDEGWGRINVTAAVQPSASRIYEDQGVVLDAGGEEWSLSLVAADPLLPLKVTLVWSDAPGSLGANPALVNDLDLVVQVGAETYRGNQFSAGWSQTGGGADALNNQENVFLQAPVSGAITVTVMATAINGDGVPLVGDATDQDFALVCSNCISAAGIIFADGFESGNVSAWSLSVP